MNYAGLVSTYRFREAIPDPKSGKIELRYPDGKRRQTNIMRAGRIIEFPDGSKGPLCFVTYTKPGKAKVMADMVVDVLDPTTGEPINQIDCTREEFEMLPQMGDPDPGTESPADLENRRRLRAEARAERARRDADARGAPPQDPAPDGPRSEYFDAPTDPPPPLPAGSPPYPTPGPTPAKEPAADPKGEPAAATVLSATEQAPEGAPTDPETKTTEPDLPSNTGPQAPPEGKEKKGGKSKGRTK